MREGNGSRRQGVGLDNGDRVEHRDSGGVDYDSGMQGGYGVVIGLSASA